MRAPLSTYALRWGYLTFMVAMLIGWALEPGGVSLTEWRVIVVVSMVVPAIAASLIGLRRWLRG